MPMHPGSFRKTCTPNSQFSRLRKKNRRNRYDSRRTSTFNRANAKMKINPLQIYQFEIKFLHPVEAFMSKTFMRPPLRLHSNTYPGSRNLQVLNKHLPATSCASPASRRCWAALPESFGYPDCDPTLLKKPRAARLTKFSSLLQQWGKPLTRPPCLPSTTVP